MSQNRSSARLARRDLKAYFPGRDLAYHLHVLPEHGVAYVKNPKAGCSTVLVWLSRLHSGDHTYSPRNIHQQNPIQRPNEIGWQKVMRMLSGEAYRFSFVREPLGRLESAYRDKIAQAGRDYWRQQVRATLGLDRNEDDITFDQFLAALEAQDPVSEMDPHWRPQHVNLMYPTIEYERVGRLENFSVDLSRICEEAGLPQVPVEARNTSRRRENSVYDGRPDLVKRAQELFARDIELYGY